MSQGKKTQSKFHGLGESDRVGNAARGQGASKGSIKGLHSELSSFDFVPMFSYFNHVPDYSKPVMRLRIHLHYQKIS